MHGKELFSYWQVHERQLGSDKPLEKFQGHTPTENFVI